MIIDIVYGMRNAGKKEMGLRFVRSAISSVMKREGRGCRVAAGCFKADMSLVGEQSSYV